jgi:formamidopyrimidine-DNA glycosylase
MPELPEVETTRRGIEPHVRGHTITEVVVRQRRLRWPIPDALPELLTGHELLGVDRRAKYLLLRFAHGTLVGHLGMSGSLRILPATVAADKHDHLDLVFDGTLVLRYRDPRRFGAWLWQTAGTTLPQLRKLGPEPLDEGFTVDHFVAAVRARRKPIKNLLMDQGVVVGVGNIYACEALFAAGIHPNRTGDRISRSRLVGLLEAIRSVLKKAIDAGGTTLKDFTASDGSPGYFAQQLMVYGRDGHPCPRCSSRIARITLAGRSTFYCPGCQT